MAGKNEYLDEAYNTLLKLSANGRSVSEIAELLSFTEDDMLRILEESKKINIKSWRVVYLPYAPPVY